MRVIRNAVEFSPCEKYRYVLTRSWDSVPNLMVIALNPSTADLYTNDPTVAKCVNYAKLWGFGGLTMTNVFAFRATDPKDMLACDEPIGEQNDWWLYHLTRKHPTVLWACGNDGMHLDRLSRVWWFSRSKENVALEINKNGCPKHPLYCKQDLKPIPYTWRD